MRTLNKDISIGKKPVVDLSGERFGSLVVTGVHSRDRNKHIQWLCQCDCGRQTKVNGSHLIRGMTKSCGCKRTPRGRENKLWSGYGEISSKVWSEIQRGAKSTRRRVIDFEINIEYAWDLFLLQDRCCALSRVPIYFPERNCDSGTASLDRIDSSIGYICGNVQWVHKDINKMKNTLDQDYFIKMCGLVSGFSS